MELNKNNNNQILYRIAKNNLLSKKTSSFFCMLSILLSVTLVSTLILFVIGGKYAEQQMLNKMQHVMYMNVTQEQIKNIESDKRTEVCIPYKTCEKEFQTNGVKYSFYFFGSHQEAITTYILVEGTAPQKYNEIVVDKRFMTALGKESKLGTSITLDLGDITEEFIVSGFTDDKYTILTHPIRTSKEFAEQSPIMKDLPYTALVRLNDISDVSVSIFTSIVYQIAMDYGIERLSVNTNGKFEQSLQSGNSELYIIFFVAILLFAASSIVIYSIFYFSVVSRVQQIGQFQTIGMTQKQVKKMISREGLLLSVFSIPIGLLISGVVSYFLLPDGWSFKNYGIVILLVSIAGLLIVQMSIRKPASIASKISPVEASRNSNAEIKEKASDRKHKYLSPYTLAQIETRNNRKKWWLTTVSLAFGSIIFMVAVTWFSSWNEDDYSRQALFKDSEYYISYLYTHDSPKTYGITDMQLVGHLGEELEENIRKIPNVKDVQIERAVTGVIEYQGSMFTQEFYPLTQDNTEYFQISAEGNNTYEYMAENDAILITNSHFSERINGVVFEPGKKITFRYFDGEEHTIELEIAAVSPESVELDTMHSNFCMSDITMNKLWNKMNTINSFSISVEDYEKNDSQVERELRLLLNKYNDLSLRTLREQKLEDSGQIQRLKIQIYGISVFIILFSIFNLINTVISNIAARKKELSMLESIGMEQRQVQNMLFWESFLLALPNILITLTVGTLSGFGFIHFMQKSANYLHYRFPILAFILYIIVMISFPILISFCYLKKQNNIPLVERIKNDD